jgi:Flp pilus assembly pilin Flp
MSLLEVLLAPMRAEQGQTFVEYALLLAVVVVGALLAGTGSSLAPAIQAAVNTVISAV